MNPTVADFLNRLLPFAPEIELLVQALEAGVSGDAKVALMDSIKAAMIAASDEAMKKEAGLS